MQQMQGTLKPADQEGYITVITPDESCDVLVKHSLPVKQSVLVDDVCELHFALNTSQTHDNFYIIQVIRVSFSSFLYILRSIFQTNCK